MDNISGQIVVNKHEKRIVNKHEKGLIKRFLSDLTRCHPSHKLESCSS